MRAASDCVRNQEFLGISWILSLIHWEFLQECIAKPLTSLLEKGKDFKWTDDCQNSFEELKRRLTTAPVLAMPDIHKNFDIYCDASHQGLGCVLMQEGRVIAYASR